MSRARLAGPARADLAGVIWTDRVRLLKDAGAIGYLAVSSPPPGWERHTSFLIPSTFYSSVPGGPEPIELPEAQILGGGTTLVSLGPAKRVDHYWPTNPEIWLVRPQDASNCAEGWMSNIAYPKAVRTGERWFAGAPPPARSTWAPDTPHMTRTPRTWATCAARATCCSRSGSTPTATAPR